MPITVKCLASGSTGNSYAVDDGASVLLLEAGIPAKKILSGYLELLPRVAATLISHEHGDHASGVAGIAAAGIDLYATAGTFAEIPDIDRPYRKHTVRIGEQFDLGSWIVLPFETKHDAMEPCGYLLYSKTAQERLLFATDTYFIPNTFRALNVVMLECNYSLPLLDKAIADGTTPAFIKPRLLQSHFGLENVKDFFRVNDMSAVRKIYLIHISRGNGDPEQFVREVRRITRASVTAF
jgi:phosphoribosyl 1,2-cyclic phosphodiesterase